MEILDLGAVIRETKTDRTALADLLFPQHKQPSRALKRIIDGGAELDAIQISKLAMYLNCKVADLFSENYEEIKTESDYYEWTIKAKGFFAILNTRTFKLRIFSTTNLLHEGSIVKQTIPLNVLVNKVYKIINEYETRKQRLRNGN